MSIAQWKWKLVTLSGFRETMCAIYALLILNSSLVWKKTSLGTIWCKKDDENTYSYRSILCFFRIHFLFFFAPSIFHLLFCIVTITSLFHFLSHRREFWLAVIFELERHWWSERKIRNKGRENPLLKVKVVGSSGPSLFAAVVCCIMKVREMWIHLLELYVSISLLVRLISILSLGWEIRWLNLTTSRNVSVRFKLFCKLCCFMNISTRGLTET